MRMIVLLGAASFMIMACAKHDDPNQSRANSESASLTARGGGSSNDSRIDEVQSRGRIASATAPAEVWNSGTTTNLGAESQLMVEEGLSVDLSLALLESEAQFEAMLHKFEADATRSPEARDITGIYRSKVMASLGGSGTMSSLSCGHNLCIGSVRVASLEAYREWSARFAEQGTSPTFGFGESTKALRDGQYQTNFVFSIDPSNRSSVLSPGS
jgi:hypothetical protein